MNKKPHPADIYEAQKRAECTRFKLFAFSGPGQRYSEEYDTLQEVREALPAFESKHCRFGRRGTIYGLHPLGANYFIP